MSFEFSQRDLEKIAGVLGVAAAKTSNGARYDLSRPELGRKLSLEIYPNIRIGRKRGNLVSVYTPTAHLQLHFCTGYVASETLGEVTFVGEVQGKLSGLIVEREAGCSLYANVDSGILSGDFTTLGPEVMLSGIALSLTEEILPAREHSSAEGSARRPMRSAGKKVRRTKVSAKKDSTSSQRKRRSGR